MIWAVVAGAVVFFVWALCLCWTMDLFGWAVSEAEPFWLGGKPRINGAATPPRASASPTVFDGEAVDWAWLERQMEQQR